MELQKLSLEETIEDTNKLIDSFAGNSRQVISTQGSVNQVSPEKLLAILRVADERKI